MSLKKLRDLCQPKDPDLGQIRELVQRCKEKDVVDCCLENGSVLNHVLSACSSKMDDFKLKLSTKVIRDLMVRPDQSKSDLLMFHLDSDPWSDRLLSSMVDVCVTELDEAKHRPLNAKWLVILAKLISVIGEKTLFVTDEDEMEGQDYRDKILRKMCLDRWAPNDSVHLVQMFRDVANLTPEELDMMMEKTCSVMTAKLHQSPEEIPPLVYQVLALCRSRQMLPNTLPRMLTALTKLYNNVPPDKEPDTADMIGSEMCQESKHQSESTVVFHLTHAVRMGHPIEKDCLKLLKSSTQLPEVVFNHRFVLFLSLALSSVKKLKPVVLEHLRLAACRSIGLKTKAQNNEWLRQTLPDLEAIDNVFEGLVEQTSKFGGWELIGQGVVELAMSLLDAKTQRSVWETGQSIVSSVVSLRSEAVGDIVRQLVKTNCVFQRFSPIHGGFEANPTRRVDRGHGRTEIGHPGAFGPTGSTWTVRSQAGDRRHHAFGRSSQEIAQRRPHFNAEEKLVFKSRGDEADGHRRRHAAPQTLQNQVQSDRIVANDDVSIFVKFEPSHGRRSPRKVAVQRSPMHGIVGGPQTRTHGSLFSAHDVVRWPGGRRRQKSRAARRRLDLDVRTRDGSPFNPSQRRASRRRGTA